MKIGIRMLLGYFLIVAIAGYFVLNIFVDKVKPGIRYASEEILRDSSALVAKMIEQNVVDGKIDPKFIDQAYNSLVIETGNFPLQTLSDYRIYLTDKKGIVVYDSGSLVKGQDFSKMPDIVLALMGKYGVRSALEDPEDSNSVVVYASSPIIHNNEIVGSLTLAKSNKSLLPIIRRSELQLEVAGFFLLGIALLIGILFVGWLTHSITSLVNYATDVANGNTEAELPKLENSELKILAEALHKMRIKLEGKNYVESYVHTLTHELKSPLAAIRGAAEILQETPPPPAEVTRRFSVNIEQQSKRLQLLVERMLLQANVESRLRLETSPIDLCQLINDVVASKEAQAANLHIELDSKVKPPTRMKDKKIVLADPLLLSQALTNVIENAFDFTPADGIIEIRLENSGNMYQIIITDSGTGIPAYAQDKIFDRFYSLPRPKGKGKSTGLGLSFVREVMQLHKGNVVLKNAPGRGAMAILSLLRYS